MEGSLSYLLTFSQLVDILPPPGPSGKATSSLQPGSHAPTLGPWRTCITRSESTETFLPPSGGAAATSLTVTGFLMKVRHQPFFSSCFKSTKFYSLSGSPLSIPNLVLRGRKPPSSFCRWWGRERLGVLNSYNSPNKSFLPWPLYYKLFYTLKVRDRKMLEN